MARSRAALTLTDFTLLDVEHLIQAEHVPRPILRCMPKIEASVGEDANSGCVLEVHLQSTYPQRSI
jgi:hypothetical protein